MSLKMTAITSKSAIYLLVTILPFLVYWNSINNEYGMDDYYVTEGNPKVAQGISGIPEIFTSYYASTDTQRYEYRPLVQTTYAIEKSIFRNLPASQTIEEKQKNDLLTQANVSHLINIVFYAINCLLLLLFLSRLLKNYSFYLPLIITILFLVHPIHTEVVNNLKSRDELLMMGFLLATLICLLRYAHTGLKKPLIFSGLFIFLAFLSKMNAFAIFGLIPVIFYYINTSKKKIVISWLVMGAVTFGVLLIREALPGEPYRDLQFFENPLFIEDGFMNRLMLALYSAFEYLKMLIYPVFLSFYYGYDQIPIADFSYWQVWVPIIVLVPLGIYGLIRWWKKDVLGLALVLWLGVMAGSINLTYPLVGIVAERFAYTFSIGFVMTLGILIWRGYAFAKAYKTPAFASALLITVVLLVSVIYSHRTIDRNEDWENRIVLFRNDIQHLEDSYRAHTFLADELFVQLPVLARQPDGTDYIREVEALYERANEIDDSQSNPHNNLGAIRYMFYEDYERAITNFNKAQEINPTNIETLLNLAYSHGELAQYGLSVQYLEKALEQDASLQPAWTYVLSLIKKPQAQQYLKQVFTTLPKKNEAIIQQKEYWTTVGQFYGQLGNAQVAVDSFAKAFLLDTSDTVLGEQVVRFYTEMGDAQKATFFKNKL